MEKRELLKYIDFSLKSDVMHYEQGDGSIIPGSILALKKYPDGYTYMIGHQPTFKEGTEELDYDDPYWTDDVGSCFSMDYMNPIETIKDGELFIYKAIIAGKEFEILIENDCGFAVAYGSPEIFKYVNDEQP